MFLWNLQVRSNLSIHAAGAVDLKLFLRAAGYAHSFDICFGWSGNCWHNQFHQGRREQANSLARSHPAPTVGYDRRRGRYKVLSDRDRFNLVQRSRRLTPPRAFRRFRGAGIHFCPWPSSPPILLHMPQQIGCYLIVLRQTPIRLVRLDSARRRLPRNAICRPGIVPEPS